MDKLRRYLKTLTVTEQKAFALRAGTSLGHLRNVLSKQTTRIDGCLCRRLEEESKGAVPRESLRPDIWPERVTNTSQGETA